METGIAHKSTLNASASRQLHMYLETDMMVGRTSTKQDAFQLSHEPRGLSELVAGGHQISQTCLESLKSGSVCYTQALGTNGVCSVD